MNADDEPRRTVVALAGGLESSILGIAGDIEAMLGTSPFDAIGVSPTELLGRAARMPQAYMSGRLGVGALRFRGADQRYLAARWVPGPVGGALLVTDVEGPSVAACVHREVATTLIDQLRSHLNAARAETLSLLGQFPIRAGAIGAMRRVHDDIGAALRIADSLLDAALSCGCLSDA